MTPSQQAPRGPRGSQRGESYGFRDLLSQHPPQEACVLVLSAQAWAWEGLACPWQVETGRWELGSRTTQAL